MIEEKRIEIVKSWPEPKSIRDIQVFLGFANIYKRFIRNFGRIAITLTSILQIIDKTIDHGSQSTKVTKKAKNSDMPGDADSSRDGGVSDAVGENVENLSTNKLMKAKKPNLAKF